MSDVLAFWLVAGPTYAVVVWANDRFAQRLNLSRRSTWFFIAWLLICASVPSGAGILAAWAVSR